MLIANNPEPPISEFVSLLSQVNTRMNSDAKERPSYYQSRDGRKLETDVCDMMQEFAKGTAFEGHVKLVSGQKFPDITAKKFYGVEVKSTTQDHWITTGNSVLESTRVEGIERIFLMFGKLAPPIQFKVRPYEDCLSDVVVTHYPRYRIDMSLAKGSTIFDKIKIPYDTLRTKEDPIAPIVDYYKRSLKPGESLWWIDSNIESEAPPLTIKFWSSLNKDEKTQLICYAMAHFPEVFGGKYERFVLWLVTTRSIVSTSMRDSFSAGGQVDIKTRGTVYPKVQRVFQHAQENMNSIIKEINLADANTLINDWQIKTINNSRIEIWVDLVIRSIKKDQSIIRNMLNSLVGLNG